MLNLPLEMHMCRLQGECPNSLYVQDTSKELTQSILGSSPKDGIAACQYQSYFSNLVLCGQHQETLHALHKESGRKTEH